jgi:hypothetical protein
LETEEKKAGLCNYVKFREIKMASLMVLFAIGNFWGEIVMEK